MVSESTTYTVWVRLHLPTAVWTRYASGVPSVEAAVELMRDALVSGSGVVGGCVMPGEGQP